MAVIHPGATDAAMPVLVHSQTVGVVSGLESFNRPSIAVANVLEAVVQAAWPSLPEFDALGNHAVAAPEIRQWHFAFAEFTLHLYHFLFQ
jgi:hypothetical protein